MSEGSTASSDPTLVFDLAGRPDAAQLLDRLYREILVPSFRKEELDPYETLAAGLTEEPRNIDISAAWKDSDEILGAMVGEWYPPHRVYLLSYLAALPSRRSSGTGTSLMRHLTEWSRGRQALMTLAEVDDPRRHATEALIGDPEARLAFYGRFGARVLDLPYFQPRLMTAGRRAHGMLLLAFDVHADALEDGPVAALRADILAGFLRAYFAECEGTSRASAPKRQDPELGRLIDRASSKAGVRLLPIERYTEVPPDVG